MDRLSLFQRWLIGLPLVLCGSALVYAAEPSVAAGIGNPATNRVILPFEIRRGHVMVPAKVNGSNSLSLLLDTGYGMTMLHPDHVKDFGLRRTGRITIVGIAGEEPAGVFEGPTFDFSGTSWKPRRVAAFPADNSPRARRRDGILGSSFFRRFVVEIEPLRKIIVLYQPDGFDYSGNGEYLPLSFEGSTPIVEATVSLPDGTPVKAPFEIDTGCDGALCIGKHFVETHQLVPSYSSPAGGRRGVGGSARVHNGHLRQITLGKIVIAKPEASFFLESSPVDPPLAGHIGWDLLKRFKVIFDSSRKRLVLESVE
jgi:predicted aspartyl protease